MTRLAAHGNHSLGERPIFSVAVDHLAEAIEEIRVNTPRFICFLALDAGQMTDQEIRSSANSLLKLGCTYFCIWGPGCERAHDLVDQEDLDLHPDGPWAMTTWHSRQPLLDGLWHSLHVAWPDPAFENEPHSIIAITVGSKRWASKVAKGLSNPTQFAKTGFTDSGSFRSTVLAFLDRSFK